MAIFMKTYKSLNQFKIMNTKSLKYNLTFHTFDLWGLAELPNGYIISGGKDSKILVTK